MQIFTTRFFAYLINLPTLKKHDITDRLEPVSAKTFYLEFLEVNYNLKSQLWFFYLRETESDLIVYMFKTHMFCYFQFVICSMEQRLRVFTIKVTTFQCALEITSVIFEEKKDARI